jgi:hypothetical protein
VKNQDAPRISAVERLKDGVMVKFTDGTCVFYPASLLYEMIPEAEKQDEAKATW